MEIGRLENSFDSGSLRSTARQSAAFEKLMREARKENETAPSALSSAPAALAPSQQGNSALPRADIVTYTRKTDAQIREEISTSPERKKLYDSAQEFQSLLLGQMLGAMRKNLHKENELLNGGRTEEIFEDYLYDEYSKAMSKQPGFNLSDEIYRQLTANLPPATDVASPLPKGMSTEQLHRRGPGL